jgi:hypothetical protein
MIVKLIIYKKNTKDERIFSPQESNLTFTIHPQNLKKFKVLLENAEKKLFFYEKPDKFFEPNDSTVRNNFNRLNKKF